MFDRNSAIVSATFSRKIRAKLGQKYPLLANFDYGPEKERILFQSFTIKSVFMSFLVAMIVMGKKNHQVKEMVASFTCCFCPPHSDSSVRTWAGWSSLSKVERRYLMEREPSAGDCLGKFE